MQKGDAEKCVCGANGGECNATRAEPAAECSSEPNSEVASCLSATVPRNKNEGKKKEEGREDQRGTGPVMSPPPPPLAPGEGPLSSRMRARCRSAPCRRYDPPADRYGMQKISFIFQYLGNTGSRDIHNPRYLEIYLGYKKKVSHLVRCFVMLIEAAPFYYSEMYEFL